MPEELEIFANLSRVCRFFANFCLPRIFEFVEFSGAIFCDDTRAAVYKPSRESTLCTQIVAGQPLALALAKAVRVCHFTNWNVCDHAGAWAVRLFAKKYIAGVSHMKNIRELKFFDSFVDAEHWNAIAILESLEDLSFDFCSFTQGPADVEPEKWVKLKVSRLEVVKSKRLLQPIAAVDARWLHSLAMDYTPYDRFDWLLESALTELRLYLHFDCWNLFREDDGYREWVHAILMQTPRSLETLGIFLDVPLGPAPDVIKSMFDHTVWKNLALLRSLTLRVLHFHQDTPTVVSQTSLSSVLHGCLTRILDTFRSLGGHWSPRRTTIIHAERRLDVTGDVTHRDSMCLA